MNQTKSKAETFLGFVLRSGKYRLGGNAIATLKSANLLILCHTAEKNSVVTAKKLAKKFGVKIVVINHKTLESVTGKDFCKIMAVLDSSLAQAILDNLGEDFTELI